MNNGYIFLHTFRYVCGIGGMEMPGWNGAMFCTADSGANRSADTNVAHEAANTKRAPDASSPAHGTTDAAASPAFAHEYYWGSHGRRQSCSPGVGGGGRNPRLPRLQSQNLC